MNMRKYRSNERRSADEHERSQRALDAALDLSARHAERMLADAEDIGIMLIPLDSRLQPMEPIRVPFNEMPPTSHQRRQRLERLARRKLRSAAGYIGVAEAWRAPSLKPSEEPDREEVVHLHAETRVGVMGRREYRIIRHVDAPPTLELDDPGEELLPGLFSGLLDTADGKARDQQFAVVLVGVPDLAGEPRQKPLALLIGAGRRTEARSGLPRRSSTQRRRSRG